VKKLYSLAAMAMLLPLFGLAQFKISGKVTDQANNQPLAGASIKVGTISVQTNAGGDFTAEGLSAGTYSLKISFLGFRTYTSSFNLNEDKVFNVQLQPSRMIADEVIVKATRAGDNTPTTFRNVGAEELQKNNLGQDLPYLLNQTPSVVVSSDAGNGVGYTGIRIRGSDPTRVNVTINGIPYNDPESQGTFWVNMPDFASSVDNIQIQRGVGTSTNGAGAFGGSLNVQTTTLRDSAYAELNNSAGSFSTMKNTVLVGTGLINGKFSFDGRLSKVSSDGYIDRGASNLKSYFLSGSYYGKSDLLRVNVFSGTEKTYQAWNGVPEELLKTNRTYNAFDYKDQTDNYTQDHYQLLYTHTFSEKLTANAALHYTYGRGYFEELKDGASLESYGLSPVSIGDSTIEETNLVRRRWLRNDFYGLTYSLNYIPTNKLNFTLGGAYNEYDGDHFGEVIWAEYASNSRNDYRYYSGNGFKTDFNIYGRGNYQLGRLNLYADLQYRRVSYTISGTDKNRTELDQDDEHNFFNPKAGVSFNLDQRNKFYASFAVANKEPNRDDYVNSTPATRPLSENLKDIEAGYALTGRSYRLGVNAYGMFYKDQLILTGKVTDVGEPIRQNVGKSYRAGIELDGGLSISRVLSWAATATWSANRIKDFTEVIYIYDDNYNVTGQVENKYTDTKIAFSPAFIGSSEFSYRPLKNIEAAFLTKYVGSQYLDNTADDSRKLNSFFVNDLRLRFNTSFKGVRNVGITLLVNNLFDELYENNGYTYSGIYSTGLATSNFYFPQAGRNFLVSLNVKF